MSTSDEKVETGSSVVSFTGLGSVFSYCSVICGSGGGEALAGGNALENCSLLTAPFKFNCSESTLATGDGADNCGLETRLPVTTTADEASAPGHCPSTGDDLLALEFVRFAPDSGGVAHAASAASGSAAKIHFRMNVSPVLRIRPILALRAEKAKLGRWSMSI
ncbi:MAG: hypothetical protein DHS20C04_03070 [Hyphococcus sp.]|nr:MAG: hypothetical protein DHS20C04_03070 [Marinicaulis sp.]